MLARVYILLFVVVVVGVGVGVVVDALLNYCEFRHGCTSGRVASIHVALKFASICVASQRRNSRRFASTRCKSTRIDANIDTLCPA
jgi:hypothetical protein